MKRRSTYAPPLRPAAQGRVQIVALLVLGSCLLSGLAVLATIALLR